MNKKQKQTLVRILITAAVFAVLLALQLVGVLKGLPNLAVFALYLPPYLLIGYDVLRKAGRNIVRGNVFDENFLMSIATLAAFALGLFGEAEYPEAVAVMLFYQVGELFQSCAVGRSRKSIGDLLSLAPETANLITESGVETVDPDEVEIGARILVKPGEKVPLDGTVQSGSAYLDTAALTGESVPRLAQPGDAVISGCVVTDAPLTVEVTRRYEDSTVARILEMVENATNKKAKLENFITRFAKYYTPFVTLAAVLLALLLPLAFHTSWADGIRRACNFLIVSCPCALVISVPLGFFGGIGAASRIGVLVKGSNFLEAVAKMNVLAMDKTGTLTHGSFAVQEILPAEGRSETELLRLAALGESCSNHPIALALRARYGEPLDASALGEIRELAGQGVRAAVNGQPLLVGNAKLLAEHGVDFTPCDTVATVVYVALNGSFCGAILIGDTVKPGAKAALSALKRSGVGETVMLTGDRKAAALAVAEAVGVDTVQAELLPADKVTAVEALLQSKAPGTAVGYVGDGLNDAPVLMRADVGFAMGALGADAAIEAADIVLMDDDLGKLPRTVAIARKTMGIVKGNVAFALAVKLAILVLSAFGLASMWMAVFGDVGVAVLCILNAMRN